MLKKQKKTINELTFINLEELVPEDHLVRKLANIDYEFIYDEIKEYYAKDGRPSIDPVVLFKIILIKTIYGYKSIKSTLADVEVNLAFRWFLNLKLSDKVPHHSVISNNFNYRFDKNILNKIFKIIFNDIANLDIDINKNIVLNKINYKVKKINHKKIIEIDEKNLYEKTLV